MQVRNIKKNLWPISKADKMGKFDSVPHKDKRVYGVYHIFCVNVWNKLLVEQLEAIKDSGLMDITDKLYISCIYCDKNDLVELEKILGGFPIAYKIMSALPVENNQYEFPALQFMHDLSFKEDFYVYYFHK